MTRWRYRCPEGHTSITPRTRLGGYRCEPCGEVYDGEPIDVRAQQ